MLLSNARQWRGYRRFAGFAENLFKMQGLWGADHVPDAVRFQSLEAIIDCRDVGGGIIKTAIAFANDAWLIRQLRDIAKENNNGALADLGNAGLEQTFNYIR